MTIKEEILFIELLTKDLKASVLEYDRRSKMTSYRKPYQGLGATVDGEDPGLQQGETSFAIERKIVTLREHLNSLRKRIV